MRLVNGATAIIAMPLRMFCQPQLRKESRVYLQNLNGLNFSNFLECFWQKLSKTSKFKGHIPLLHLLSHNAPWPPSNSWGVIPYCNLTISSMFEIERALDIVAFDGSQGQLVVGINLTRIDKHNKNE